MPWTLSRAKASLSIAGTANDAAITELMNTVIGTVEDYLGRALLFKRETITFWQVDNSKIFLPRFPIRRVIAINGNTTIPNDFTVHHRTGWVSFECSSLFNFVGCGRSVSIEYEGGYDINNLPDSLEKVLWEIFLQWWGNSNQTIGGPAVGAGPTVTAGSGDLKSLTVYDGFKLDYDVGATVTGGASNISSSGSTIDTWGELAPWASMLSIYRSEHGVGLGFA